MSTIPEVLVAVHAGLRVLGFSIVTDMCLPDALQPVSIEEIIAVAQEAEGKLRTIVKKVLERLEVLRTPMQLDRRSPWDCHRSKSGMRSSGFTRRLLPSMTDYDCAFTESSWDRRCLSEMLEAARQLPR